MMGLTPKQERARAFIATENAAGRFPTFERIAQGIGAKSKSQAFYLVEALIERGRVVRTREGLQVTASTPPRAFNDDEPLMVHVPIFGRINDRSLPDFSRQGVSAKGAHPIAQGEG